MDMDDIKTDETSIFLFCNTLNAQAGALRCQGFSRLADLLIRAQGTISKLYREIQSLRGEKE